MHIWHLFVWKFKHNFNNILHGRAHLYAPWMLKTSMNNTGMAQLWLKHLRCKSSNLKKQTYCNACPQVGIMHWANSSYVKITKIAFACYNALQKNIMKPFLIVIVYSMEFLCNNWNVGFMYCTNNIWYAMNWFKFIYINFHHGAWRSFYVFL